MPELPEVEAYRRLAEGAVGRAIRSARCAPGYLRGAAPAEELSSALRAHVVVAARRRGKVLYLDLEPPDDRRRPGTSVLALRFGMTGRLVLDGRDAIGELVYSSRERRPEWDRFTLRFSKGGALVVNDARRLGWVELDPDEQRLGPDALRVTAAALRTALAGSAVALKARLMDQRRIAGIGNLICDEVLWRAGLAPTRPSGELGEADLRRLRRHLAATLEDLLDRGGSHQGDMWAERHRDGRCPRDGAALRRDTVGGRTTYWCPAHQH